ncbi:hypothetical protein MYX07_05650 [Patescibacteria group bacterium AH-259-L07]|nr:hypothetical protein [Patescibacteria group bacterium AH-259-L07]
MRDKDKKLDFDLGFLDEESPKPKKTFRRKRTESEPSAIDPSKRNWKVVSIVGGVILVVIWISFSGDSTPAPTYTPNTPSTNQVRRVASDDVIIGEYRCSRNHYDRAVALQPSESEQQLTIAQYSMEIRANELERLENELQYSSVEEYSPQYQIDEYNAKIDTYNSKLASYNRDAAAFDSSVDRYNNQIEAHNSYLVRNCTSKK